MGMEERDGQVPAVRCQRGHSYWQCPLWLVLEVLLVFYQAARRQPQLAGVQNLKGGPCLVPEVEANTSPGWVWWLLGTLRCQNGSMQNNVI